MSEPRHVWMTPTGHTGVYIEVTPDYPRATRYTLTDGDEYRALIELAREALKAYPHSAVGKEGALRDLLDYLEGDK